MKKYFTVGDLISVELYHTFERFKVTFVKNSFVSLVSITDPQEKITVYGQKFKEILCDDDRNLEGLLIYNINSLGIILKTTEIKF